MKKILFLLMVIALFSCEKGESEYIHILDIHKGDLLNGSHDFTFSMIEAGEFKITAKIGNASLNQLFYVRNNFLKADTTNNNPSGTSTEIASLSLNKYEFLVDEDIYVELDLIVPSNVELMVYKKSD
ncbi:MAG: hypothetical protein U9R19_10375 [Bacteroidota bacterium]|nr:hypothetical protein [Bacteroidota bacterium]